MILRDLPRASEVQLDGKVYHSSGTMVRQLSPGAHRVLVRTADGRVGDQIVDIVAGSQKVVTVVLHRVSSPTAQGPVLGSASRRETEAGRTAGATHGVEDHPAGGQSTVQPVQTPTLSVLRVRFEGVPLHESVGVEARALDGDSVFRGMIYPNGTARFEVPPGRYSVRTTSPLTIDAPSGGNRSAYRWEQNIVVERSGAEVVLDFRNGQQVTVDAVPARPSEPPNGPPASPRSDSATTGSSSRDPAAVVLPREVLPSVRALRSYSSIQGIFEGAVPGVTADFPLQGVKVGDVKVRQRGDEAEMTFKFEATVDAGFGLRPKIVGRSRVVATWGGGWQIGRPTLLRLEVPDVLQP